MTTNLETNTRWAVLFGVCLGVAALSASAAHAQNIPTQGGDMYGSNYSLLAPNFSNDLLPYNPYLVNPAVVSPTRDAHNAVQTEQAKRVALANHAKAVRQYWQQRNIKMAQSFANEQKTPDIRNKQEAERLLPVIAAEAQQSLLYHPKVFQRPTKDELDRKTGAIKWPPVFQTEFFKPYREELESLFAKTATGKHPRGVNSANYQMVEAIVQGMSQELHAFAGGIPQQDYIDGLAFLNKLSYEAMQSGPDLTQTVTPIGG